MTTTEGVGEGVGGRSGRGAGGGGSGAAGGGSGRAAGVLGPLRLAGFRHLAVGQLVSSTGNAMYKTGQAWLLIGAAGGSGTLIGLLALFQLAPLLLLGGYGGLLADRLPPRRLLLCTQSAHALLCAVLATCAFTGTAGIGVIYALTLAAGLVTVADNPARQRLLTELVGETRLSRALGLYTALLNTGQLLGPLAAGLLIGWAHIGWIFVVDAATFLFVVGVLLTLPGPDGGGGRSEDRYAGRGGDRQAGRDGDPQAGRDDAAAGGGGALRAGLREIARRPAVALTVAASAVVGSVGVQFTVTNALMATEVFHLSATAFGVLPTAVTAGCLLGALLAGRHPDPGPYTVLVAAAATGAAGAASGLAPGVVPFVVLLVAAGAATMFFTTVATVLLTQRTAPGIRGRVLAVQTTALYGSGPAGALLIGAGAAWTDPRTALVAAGVLTLALCAVLAAVYRGRGQKA
ncbi:MFS transporter [Streptomyces antimicrobicus]|uniref:MFS transporter n=1 Tax=Streptomyces antimicrobicus TaxID=2883108 RepID=A0ABS8B341_9ACTN|nr:MFS transporter [Streptomyces antimicrobicus]MCB5179007.1 MFS transporter [Streptomyces antimicrobicus]